MSVRTLSMLLFAMLSAAMLGLAAGAVWMVAALYLRHPLPWLALPVGALLAWSIRGYVRPAGAVTALLSASATLLAAVYVNMLVASTMIAGSMGLGLVDAMRTAGTGMLWQLARMALAPADVGWAVLGMVVAAWLGWRRSRQR